MPSDAEGHDTETLLLDEEDELYGWGVLNVHLNAFVTPLESNPQDDDADLFQTKDEALEYLSTLEDEQESVSHLRIVRVHLATEVEDEFVS